MASLVYDPEQFLSIGVALVSQLGEKLERGPTIAPDIGRKTVVELSSL